MEVRIVLFHWWQERKLGGRTAATRFVLKIKSMEGGDRSVGKVALNRVTYGAD